MHSAQVLHFKNACLFLSFQHTRRQFSIAPLGAGVPTQSCTAQLTKRWLFYSMQTSELLNRGARSGDSPSPRMKENAPLRKIIRFVHSISIRFQICFKLTTKYLCNLTSFVEDYLQLLSEEFLQWVHVLHENTYYVSQSLNSPFLCSQIKTSTNLTNIILYFLDPDYFNYCV